MARSTKPSVVTVQMIRPANGGKNLPLYLGLGQRHFEKEMPTGVKVEKGVEYIIPVDLIRLYGVEPELVEEIEEVKVVYQARS